MAANAGLYREGESLGKEPEEAYESFEALELTLAKFGFLPISDAAVRKLAEKTKGYGVKYTQQLRAHSCAHSGQTMFVLLGNEHFSKKHFMRIFFLQEGRVALHHFEDESPKTNDLVVSAYQTVLSNPPPCPKCAEAMNIVKEPGGPYTWQCGRRRNHKGSGVAHLELFVNVPSQLVNFIADSSPHGNGIIKTLKKRLPTKKTVRAKVG